jgi:hypothetical protein
MWREKRLEKWKQHMRKSPLGILERKALAELYGLKEKTPRRIHIRAMFAAAMKTQPS